MFMEPHKVIIRIPGFLLVVKLLTAGSGIVDALADPMVTETFDYYDVDGATAQEIRTDLNRRGPIDGTEHRRFDAVTHWQVRWRYTYKDVGGGCGITTVSTNADITYAFPRLLPRNSAPAALRQAFAGYLENLLVHEKGHARVGIDIATRIEAGIRRLPAAPTCTALSDAANDLGQSLIKEANRLDIDYDAQTQHGKTQGARFP
jgi:predicted secreted Zn-dependent protease